MDKLKPIVLLLALFLPFQWVLAEDFSAQLEAAKSAYDAEKYDEAAKIYQSVLDAEQVSAALFYNLGNAKFKQGDIPGAILNYERGLRLAPDDADLLYNLDLARAQTKDSFEELPSLEVTRAFRQFVMGRGAGGWAWWSILLIFMAALAGAGFFWTQNGALKRIAFGVGLLFLLGSFVAQGFGWQARAWEQFEDEAILMSPVVSLMSEPKESAKELVVVHAGTKVALIESVDGWMRVSLPDGNEGWVAATDLEEI